MKARLKPVINCAALILMNIFALIIGAAFFDYAADALGIASCVSSKWTVDCEIPRGQVFEWWPHVNLLALAILAFGVTRTYLYRFSIAPFSLLMIVLLIFCLGFDLILQLPVKNFSRLFSSTFNLTSFIIFLSFIFIVAITPYDWRLGWRFMGGMIQSYLARDLAFLLYAAVQQEYLGMTSLYLMFVAFSFGAITIHIMSIAGILRRSGELRLDAPILE
jgi:hypothetical protein